jgi:alkylhydroperoxidase family enzyme
MLMVRRALLHKSAEFVTSQTPDGITVTRVADTDVPDADYAAARAAFGEADLADLTIAIGLMNAYNRMAISFRTTPAGAR